MDARYLLLIQKQFDQPLSERETYELQGFLAGNEAAARLCENVRRLLDECEELEIPEHLKPVDAEYLLTEILSALTQTQSRSWFSFVKQFVKGNKEKPRANSAHQDELAVLRKHKASAERSSKAMDSLRAKVVSEFAPVSQPDAVSLAEAIKRRMLSGQVGSETCTSDLVPEESKFISPPHLVQSRIEFDNAPTPTISESMDQLFSSSNWPVVTPESIRKEQERAQEQEQKSRSELKGEEPQNQLPELEFKANPGPVPFAAVLKNRFQQQQQQQPTEKYREQSAPGDHSANPQPQPRPEERSTINQWAPFESSEPPAFAFQQMEPIWQLEPEPPALDWELAPEIKVPIRQLEPILQETEPFSQPAHKAEQSLPSQKPSLEPERLRPASLIPVDEIIAHVSHMFSEHIPNEAPMSLTPVPGTVTHAPTAVTAIDDPLRTSSGSYPQIREMDLKKARAARLATSNNFDESHGQIKALGNFLLDKHSKAAIGNLSKENANLTHARVLSDEEALALQDCLSPIESLQGVAGCIILGYDGMIITSSLPEHADKDALSAWALLTYMNTHELVRILGHSRLRQFVSRTTSGYLLLADFGQGLLLAVSDNAATDAILPLMKSVRRVTAA